MNKATRGDIKTARMLTMKQACDYTGMGRTSCLKWCTEIGAVRRFGRMLRIDKTVIDSALDAMREHGGAENG